MFTHKQRTPRRQTVRTVEQCKQTSGSCDGRIAAAMDDDGPAVMDRRQTRVAADDRGDDGGGTIWGAAGEQ